MSQRYEILLADRILNKHSVSDEAEEDVIKKLQIECGNNIISKIKTMFTDVGKSRELVKDFEDSNKTTLKNYAMDVNIQVLTAS